MSKNFLQGFNTKIEAVKFLLKREITPLKPSTNARQSILVDCQCSRQTLQRAILDLELEQMLLLGGTNALPKKYNRSLTKQVILLAVEEIKSHLGYLYDILEKSLLTGELPSFDHGYDKERLALIERYLGRSKGDNE